MNTNPRTVLLPPFLTFAGICIWSEYEDVARKILLLYFIYFYIYIFFFIFQLCQFSASQFNIYIHNKLVSATSLTVWYLPRGYKTWVRSQTQNKAQWLAACGHMSASSQLLRFILSLRQYSVFITPGPDLFFNLCMCFHHSMEICICFRYYCQLNFLNYWYWRSTIAGRRLTHTVYIIACNRVKLGKFWHQVNSVTYLQTAEIQMRWLLMSCPIRISTVCIVNYFLFQ